MEGDFRIDRWTGEPAKTENRNEAVERADTDR